MQWKWEQVSLGIPCKQNATSALGCNENWVTVLTVSPREQDFYRHLEYKVFNWETDGNSGNLEKLNLQNITYGIQEKIKIIMG